MNIPRIFISYYTERPEQQPPAVSQLIKDIRASGTEVVVDGGNTVDDTFLRLLSRELPTCKWVVIVQTPEALHSPRMQVTVDAAINLGAQHPMLGILRFILQPCDPQEVPPTWSALNAFDATQNYPEALEKLLFTLALGEPTEARLEAPAPSPSRPHQVPPQITASYDRPVSISWFQTFQRTYLNRSRRQWTIAFIILILLLIITSTGIYFIVQPKGPLVLHKATTGQTIVGQAYFTSSGSLDANGNPAADDGVQITFTNVPPPATGHSYDVWLLPDNKHNLDDVVFLGAVNDNQTMTISYMSKTHENLLKTKSHILVTEEGTTTSPTRPSTDQQTWRYFSEIPQTAGNNGQGETKLDLLRQLLCTDPKLQQLPVKVNAGIAAQLFNNTQSIYEWTLAVKEASNLPSALMMRQNLIKILDYIDGIKHLNNDGVALLTDRQGAQVGLLTLDPNDDPPGYVMYTDTHLQALAATSGTTQNEKDLIGQIHTDLNDHVQTNLQHIQQDIMTLLNMTDAQLIGIQATDTLNDLYQSAANMYLGPYDAKAGDRQGGMVWVYDHIQRLASFTITKITA